MVRLRLLLLRLPLHIYVVLPIQLNVHLSDQFHLEIDLNMINSFQAPLVENYMHLRIVDVIFATSYLAPYM